MTSYFEIDGEIISVDEVTDPYAQLPSSALEESYRLHLREQISDELTGDPNALQFSEISSSESSPGETLLERGGRVRRARRAIALAMTLAAADGPLPFGDAAAIVVLGVYAGYEINMAVGDPLQMDPFRKR